jgi:hypothetical protein
MSGDLKHPSKAIPKGTLYGLLLTFVAYTLVILAMAASITRESFYNDVNVIQDVSSQSFPLLGFADDAGQPLWDPHPDGGVCHKLLFYPDGCHWLREAHTRSVIVSRGWGGAA